MSIIMAILFKQYKIDPLDLHVFKDDVEKQKRFIGTVAALADLIKVAR